MPNAIPEPVSYPTIEVAEFVVNTCHTEVIYPASLHLIQFLNTFIETHRSGFTCDSLELLLKLLPTLVRNNCLVLALFALSIRWHKAKTKNYEINWSADAALLPVDR